MTSLLRTLDLYGSGTLLAWSRISKSQPWKLTPFSLSFLSIQPHLYVHLLIQMRKTHAPLFVLFPGPGIPALWAWHTPQGPNIPSIPSKAESVPPSLHSTAQMANHGLTPVL